MARIQYQPAARRRGFAPPKLSTAAIDRMRDESNRLIQGMERRRRAEREQDQRDLQAMQDNAAYTRQIQEENFKIRLYNEEQRGKKELDQIASQGRQEQEPFEIFEGLAKFSGTLSKAISEEANRQTKRNIAAAQVEDLGVDKLVAQAEARRAQTDGSIILNANIREDAALSNEDPLQTITNHVSNPAIVGAARQVYDNRRALALYNTLLDKYSSGTERSFTALDGSQFSGIEASRNTELTDQLHRLVKEDMMIAMGNPNPAYLADAFKTIEGGNAARMNNVRARQYKDVQEEAKEQVSTLYFSGDAENVMKAYDLNWSVFGRSAAIDEHVKQISTATDDDKLDVLLSMDFKGNGKTFAEDRPDRVVPALAERDKLLRKQAELEDELNKAQLDELIDNNIDGIYNDFQRAPDETYALWVEKSASNFGQTVPSIITGLYRQALKDTKQDELENIELQAARGMLTSDYVNNVEDLNNQRTAKGLFQEQQVRKYGENYPALMKGVDSWADGLADFSGLYAGATDIKAEQAKIAIKKFIEKDLKITGNADATSKNVEDLLRTASNNDPTNPFAYKDTEAGRQYRYIGKVDSEQVQKSDYIARVSKNKTLGEVVSIPYLLMDQNQQEETVFKAQTGVPFSYTKEVLQVADMFGVKPSEVFNAQVEANNAVSGTNTPLLEQSMFVQTLDSLPLKSAKLFSSGMEQGSAAQVRRALVPITKNPGYTRQQKRTANEFIGMAEASGAKYPELVAAQVILESAWGTSESGVNNWVGAKADEQEEGTLRETTEVVNGKTVRTTAKFKNYKSPQAGINELVNRWYKDYPGYRGVNNANSLEEAAMMLQQQGYATDPEYAQKLITIANQLR